MYTIAGIYSKKGKRFAKEQLTQATDSLDYWDDNWSVAWSDEYCAFAAYISKGWHNRAKHKPLFYDSSSNCTIVANVRLDYKEDLFAAIDGSNISDEELILKLYLKYGKNCLGYLFGDFAFAIWDGVKKQLFCARDHFGCRPFYYYESDDNFIFSTDIRMLFAFPGMECRILDINLVDSMLQLPASVAHTAYEIIKKLPPATCLFSNKVKASFTERYWDIRCSHKPTMIDEDMAISGLKERFIIAVKERVSDCQKVALELSGGLDSSAIAAAVSHLYGEAKLDIHTFTHAMDDSIINKYFPFSDQRDEVQQIIKKCNISNEHYVTGTEDMGILDSITESLLLFLRPPVQALATSSYQLYNSVKSCNLNVLLSGFGGDEGVTIQASGLLRELVRESRWTEFSTEIRKKAEFEDRNFHWDFLKFVLRSWMPTPMRILNRLRTGRDVWEIRYHTSPVTKKLKLKYHARRRYLNYIVRYRKSKNDNVKKHLFYKLHMESLENRLEESYLVTQAREIEYRYPLLDVKLVEYFYSLSSTMMYHNGIGRYAFRKAVNDMLPVEIVWRRRKSDATIPYILYLIDNEKDEIRELIKEAENENSYHYIDYKKILYILELLRGPRKGLASLISPRALFNPLSVLILQKLQREGIIDIGIKC